MSVRATFGNDNKLVRRGIRRDFVRVLLQDIGEAQKLMDSTEIEGSSPKRTDIRREVEETVNILAAIDNWENEMLDNFLRIKRCISKRRQGHERKEIVGELKDVIVKMKELKAKVNEIVPLKPEDAVDRAGKSTLIFKAGQSSNNSLASNSSPEITTSREDDDRLKSDYESRMSLDEKKLLRTIAMFPAGKPLKKRELIHCWNALNNQYIDDKTALIIFNKFIEEGVLQAKHIRYHNGLIDSYTVNPAIHRRFGSVRDHIVDGFEGLVVKTIFYVILRDKAARRLLYEAKSMINLNQKHLNTKYISKILHIFNQKEKMSIIYLAQFGRWDYSNMEEEEDANKNEYIEADGIKFLDTMGEGVRYLSLNGISRIEELPESVGKWRELMILDLRDCHNFQKWPQKPKATWRITVEENYWFWKLRHLDVTGCYLLDHMPKWLPELSNLQVLKGAVFNGFITDECRLRDIASLRKLKKLSVKITNYEFFAIEDVTALEHMDDLSVLTIIWGAQQAKEMEAEGSENPHDSLKNFNSRVEESAGLHKNKMINKEKQSGKTMPNNCWISKGKKETLENKDNDSEKMPSTISFPKNLKKLDLRCYPNEMALELENAADLKNLERLYIRGGKLRKLRGVGYQEINILRLRFLSYFDSDEKELRHMFPQLEYLEYVGCPKIKKPSSTSN